MKRFIPAAAALCALLLSAVAMAEEPAAKLISCEYSIFGGMENEDITYTAEQGDTQWEATLTVAERDAVNEYPLPWGTLDDLADYMADHDPACWASLPEREEFALDAPTRRIILTFDDGTVYSVDNERETSGPILGETESFLKSYLAAEAETFELTFSSFEGGGPEYRPIMTAPEKVWVSLTRESEAAEDPVPPGSGYTETMTFHGRIPGRTELRMEASGPLMPVPAFDEPATVYVLEVDSDYNVRLIEEKVSGKDQ